MRNSFYKIIRAVLNKSYISCGIFDVKSSYSFKSNFLLLSEKFEVIKNKIFKRM